MTESRRFLQGMFNGVLVSIALWLVIFIVAASLFGCSSMKAYYGDNWWEGWNCYSRYGVDVCSAADAVSIQNK
jgi:hypothetical protein